MINESQALKLFTQIRKMNVIKDIDDKKFTKYNFRRKKHLKEARKNNLLDEQYSELLEDEKRHVSLSENFSKKINNSNKYKLLSIIFLIQNKFRHFVSKNVYINSIINYVISLMIILLTLPFKLALNLHEPRVKKISFSYEKSKLMV